jgi:hypothetical protein
MPTAADIQKAAERIRNGTDVFSAILRMKKEAHQADNNGNVTGLGTLSHKVVPFNAPAV